MVELDMSEEEFVEWVRNLVPEAFADKAKLIAKSLRNPASFSGILFGLGRAYQKRINAADARAIREARRRG